MERTDVPLDAALLPDFTALRSEAHWEYTFKNYIETRGSVELAAAFAKLFWPDLIEHRGCIFRADGFTESSFDDWWKHANGNHTAVERVLNLLHVRELVPSDTSVLDRSVYRYIGETLAAMWGCRARLLYPSRALIARYEDLNEDGTDSEPTVYLYEDRATAPRT